MVKFVESELVQLRNEVYEMWTLVYKQMEQVKQAVLDMDADTAKQVLMRERRVDGIENRQQGRRYNRTLYPGRH